MGRFRRLATWLPRVDRTASSARNMSTVRRPDGLVGSQIARASPQHIDSALTGRSGRLATWLPRVDRTAWSARNMATARRPKSTFSPRSGPQARAEGPAHEFAWEHAFAGSGAAAQNRLAKRLGADEFPPCNGCSTTNSTGCTGGVATTSTKPFSSVPSPAPSPQPKSASNIFELTGSAGLRAPVYRRHVVHAFAAERQDIRQPKGMQMRIKRVPSVAMTLTMDQALGQFLQRGKLFKDGAEDRTGAGGGSTWSATKSATLPSTSVRTVVPTSTPPL
jgi:hypothetical protein